MRGPTELPMNADLPVVRYGTVISWRAPVVFCPPLRAVGTRSAAALPTSARNRPSASNAVSQRKRLIVVLLCSSKGTVYPPSVAHSILTRDSAIAIPVAPNKPHFTPVIVLADYSVPKPNPRGG